MFLVFWFLRFLCKFAFLRTRGGNKEWFFHRFFCIDPHYVTMTKIESRDFALIFSGKRPFNTLSKMELSDIVIVTMDFYLHSAQEMLIWNSQCHIQLTPAPTFPSDDRSWVHIQLIPALNVFQETELCYFIGPTGMQKKYYWSELFLVGEAVRAGVDCI